MTSSLHDARYLLSATDPGTLPVCPAEVTFVGRSNCGKSTLINALCRQTKLARVSQTPGRTRTLNIYAIGHRGWLVDLPGYGYATGPAEAREGWPAMIEAYLTGRPSLRCIFLMIDAKVGPTRLDLRMAHWLTTQGLAYRVIAHKVDQVKASQRTAQQQFIARSLTIPVSDLRWISAMDGTGISRLRGEVEVLLGR